MRGMSRRRVVSAATILSNFNNLLPTEAGAATFLLASTNNKPLLAFHPISHRNLFRTTHQCQGVINPTTHHSISKSSRSIRMMSSSSNNVQNKRISSSTSSTSSAHRKILTFDSLSSTQDEMRKQLMDENTNDVDGKLYLAITTKMQTKGRGTSGRTWIGKEGNTFVTIAIPTDDVKVPITLLPLQVGVIMVKRIHNIIQSNLGSATSPNVKVKWPNDVLVDGKKIAGVLIESDQDWKGNNYFLVGVGINYKYAPEVSQDGPERGRASTCIYGHIIHHDSTDEDLPMKLGQDIAHDIWDWIRLQKTWEGAADAIIENFEYWTDFGQELVLRDVPGNETVRPIQVERDGRLKVKDQKGNERLLCVDYLL